MLPPPTPGSIVYCRSRRYLVEDVVPRNDVGEDTLVRLACLDDDAQGQPLEVLWEREIDARPLSATSWQSVVAKGFDNPRWFSAFLHTVRWNCVTSTDPKLFQAPYRAGIEVKAYQLEPLRKALLMPRVNLFIADDVGLGKTIEAGLILRELLMRQKVRRVVVAAPPSVVRQWQEEMEQRFGLTFVVYDRDWVAAQRRERGFTQNPWKTHTRFVISHALLRDEAYAAPLRDWLAEESAGPAMLILDEAHNAAPSSGQKYAIDSKFTKTVSDLAPLFEHRLFLSATPHNGHPNSFAALMALLDPQRFCRGVRVTDKKLLDQVMVRRLKQDLRDVGEDFPRRTVVPVVISGLPAHAPELTLSRLLQEYRQAREARLSAASRAALVAGMLVLTSLQKRLLSSHEAFARTLAVHRAAMVKLANATPATAAPRSSAQTSLLRESVGADDERAELPEAEVQAEDDAQVAAATAVAGAALGAELALLDRMSEIAERARYQRDAKTERLLAWIEANLRVNGQWAARRVLIFTEYTDTKRYLEDQLAQVYPDAGRRVTTFHGGMGEDRREAVKDAFNADPEKHPLRILIATDAAREGINLQNHCADLYHYDVPWNPGRMEQRNGRIDRKLQKAKEVRCHYFVLPQRAEDRVLDTLVRKTGTIRDELGSLTPVVERSLARILEEGIRHERAASIASEIDGVDRGEDVGERHAAMVEDLESARPRNEVLVRQIADLQKMLDQARKWIGLDDRHFRDALSASLELLGAGELIQVDSHAADPSKARWALPELASRTAADPSWVGTLDTLRVPRKRQEKPWEWRRSAAIRPVIFRDAGTLDGDSVHLHLEHRVVQRLLGRFLAQGFVHDELRRACVILTDESSPRVVLLGRLSLYGDGAVRLHDEVVATAAEWVPPETRRGRLAALGERDKADVLELIEASLGSPRLLTVADSVKERLQAHAPRDVGELLPAMERRAETLADRAVKALTERGGREAVEMVTILEEQRKRIEARIAEIEAPNRQLKLAYAADDERQLRSDLRHLKTRVGRIDGEKETEPARIRRAYEVRARRLEPIGLVYLWPVSG